MSKIMPGLSPIAIWSSIGGAICGALGFAIGGPAVAYEAAKAGALGGAQLGVISKVEGVADEALSKTKEKVDDALNNVSQKAEATAMRAGEAAEKVLTALENGIVVLVDVGSKIGLTGYCMQLGWFGSDKTMEVFMKHCKNGSFESVNCFGLSLSNLATSALVIWAGAAAAKQIYIRAFKG